MKSKSFSSNVRKFTGRNTAVSIDSTLVGSGSLLEYAEDNQPPYEGCVLCNGLKMNIILYPSNSTKYVCNGKIKTPLKDENTNRYNSEVIYEFKCLNMFDDIDGWYGGTLEFFPTKANGLVHNLNVSAKTIIIQELFDGVFHVLLSSDTNLVDIVRRYKEAIRSKDEYTEDEEELEDCFTIDEQEHSQYFNELKQPDNDGDLIPPESMG